MSFTHKDNRDSRGNSPRVASTASLSSLSMSAVTPDDDEEAPFIAHHLAGSDERGSPFNFGKPPTTRDFLRPCMGLTVMLVLSIVLIVTGGGDAPLGIWARGRKVFVLGMPKSGTSSIAAYFSCGGMELGP